MVKDLPAVEIPDRSWQKAENLWLRPGEVDIFRGWSDLLSADLADGQPVQVIDQFFQFDGSEFLLFLTEETIYRYNVATTQGVKINPSGVTFAATPTLSWDTEIFFDEFFAVQLADGLYVWTGAGDFVAVASSPKGASLVSFSGYLLMGRLISGGSDLFQRVAWCAEQDATNWTTGDSGNIEFSEGADWVVSLDLLGDFVTVYKERSIHFMHFVGGTLVFEREEQESGVGALSKGAILNLGDEHLFLSSDDFYSFDGVKLTSIGGDIRRWFFSRLHPSHTHNIKSILIEEEGLAVWVYPSIETVNGFPDKGVVFEIETGKWTERNIPAAAFGFYQLQASQVIDDMTEVIDSYTEVFDSRTILANFPLNLFGGEAGEIFVLDDSPQGDGTDIQMEAISKEFSVMGIISAGENGGTVVAATDQEIKYVSRVWFNIDGVGVSTPIEVYLAGRDLVTDTLTFQGPVLMQVDETGVGYADFRVAARLITLKLKSTTAFRLRSYKIEFERGGPR